jgi:predicted ester cyclase
MATAVMTDPKILATTFNDTFNAHNESAIKALVSPNVRFTAPGGVRLVGKDAFAGYLLSWLKGFPDARMTVHHEIVSGPWVVQEYTFEGTHRGILSGPLGEIAPTNKKVAGNGVQLIKFENDLVIDCRLYFDMVETLSQLGIMPIAVKA